MKKLTVALKACITLAAFASTVYAGPGPGFGLGNPELMFEHMSDHLDLDATQHDTVQNILEAAKPEIEALREQVRANREALQALDPDDPAYATQLNNLALSNGQLATDGTLLATRIRTEIDAVLTDEQRQKLARGKERMRQRMESRLQSR